MKMRTICNIPCQILVISEEWVEQAYIHKPFREEILVGRGFHLLRKEDLTADQHLIHLAKNWSEALESKYYESSTHIANEVGISSSRVRQIMRLNNLHPEIQEALLHKISNHLPRNYTSQNLIKASSMSHIEQKEFLNIESNLM